MFEEFSKTFRLLCSFEFCFRNRSRGGHSFGLKIIEIRAVLTTSPLFHRLPRLLLALLNTFEYFCVLEVICESSRQIFVRCEKSSCHGKTLLRPHFPITNTATIVSKSDSIRYPSAAGTLFAASVQVIGYKVPHERAGSSPDLLPRPRCIEGWEKGVVNTVSIPETV